MPHLRNFCNILPRIHLLDRQLTILKYSSQKKKKRLVLIFRHFSGTKQMIRPRRINTLRRSSVSAAIRPLLGSPMRISFLSNTLASSTGPFTTATWDCETRHQTVRFTEMYEEEKTGREGIGAESIERDMVAHFPESLSVSVSERDKPEKRRRFSIWKQSKGLRYMVCCVAQILLSVVFVQWTVPTVFNLIP